jgi:hypothetical protein
MCYGLMLALPDDVRECFSTSDSELSVWPIHNPWVEAALGEGFRAFLVGDGRHCSCGRVRSIPLSDSVLIETEAGRLIADAADVAGHVVFLVHWFSGWFDTEEFLPEDGGGVTSYRLREGQIPYEVDRMIWVKGSLPD